MRKQRDQIILPWAALLMLLGPVLFSACSLLGFKIASLPKSDSLPTATPTLAFTMAIDTATPALESTLAAERSPVPTRTETRVPESQTATATLPAIPTSTLTPPMPSPASMPFALQLGSPKYIPAFNHSDQGCAWMGVAGQVFQSDGSGAAGLAVVVSGMVDGRQVDRAVLTANQSAYGPGGYEIYLTDHTVTGMEMVVLQLYSVENEPLSAPQVVVLPDRCDQNIVLVNFQGNYAMQKVFLPVTSNSQ